MSQHTSNNLARSGIQDALKNLCDEITIWRQHRSSLRKARRLSESANMRLHLGCGARIKPGWINIDLRDCADLSLDLRRPLPFPDDSCELIYSEHFLEHLDYPDTTFSFLAECRRILKTGGEFNVGVPETQWPLLEYAGTSSKEYFDTAKKFWHPPWCETPLEHINYHFRQDGEHKFAYDFTTLEHCLLKAGFTDVQRREFDPDLDSEERQVGTLYVKSFVS